MTKTTRPLASLLLLTTVLVDCVAYGVAWGELPLPWAYLPVLALQRSQVTLVALWLVLGSGPLALRLTCTGIVVALWSGLLATLGDMTTTAQAGALLVAQVVAVSLPYLLVLLVRRVQKPVGNAENGSSTSGLGRWQFSIACLLGWMTALAILLAVLKSLGLDDPGPWRIFGGESVVGFRFLIKRTLIVVAAGWAVLGRGPPIARAGGLAAAFVLLLLLRQPAPPGFGDFAVWSATVLALEALLLVGSLVVVRVAGCWRLDA